MDHVDRPGCPWQSRRCRNPSRRDGVARRRSARADRPFVVLKYAQTLDGRIATSTGDSRWISSEEERRLSHALRAACDSVLVGVGTVVRDDPQLTVRMVSGASPMRAVLDTTLRVPSSAKILGPGAATTVITTERSDPNRRAELRRQGVHVELVAEQAGRVSLRAALAGVAGVRDRVGPGRGWLRGDHRPARGRARRSDHRRRRPDRDRSRDAGGERPRRSARRRRHPPRESLDPRCRRRRRARLGRGGTATGHEQLSRIND